VPLAGTPDRIVYVLERIDIVGNRTSADVIRSFLPIEPGELLDVESPEIDRVRFRLLGTGWFNDVRLHLKRGSQRGKVVLVVEVEERNTLIVSRVVAGLARVVTSSTDRDDQLRPYAGLGLTETNLFGLGIGMGVSGVVSEHQAGVDLRYYDPVHLGERFDLRGRLFYNDAREFFGREPIVWGNAPCPEPIAGEPDPDCNQAVRRAVVIYERAGLGVGTGRDLSRNLRYEIEWLGEIVDVGSMPSGASTLRGEHGQERAPIDFHIEDGRSYVSSLQLGLIFDTRDDPVSPASGQLLRLDARLGAGVLGSSYDFARLEVTFKHYARLPWGHVLVPGIYVGSVFGEAPFFYQFYAADLSDLVPSRVLELNLDHRRTHNLLDTSIQEYDKEELAARLDFEYQLPLHRGGGAVRGVDAYAGAGLFMLAEREALKLGLPGYSGFERIPIDLTFDIGVQADTSIGLFKVGFSSLIGFWPDLGQTQ
jgi:outer membrane protein insertion porin family